MFGHVCTHLNTVKPARFNERPGHAGRRIHAELSVQLPSSDHLTPCEFDPNVSSQLSHVLVESLISDVAMDSIA